MTIELNTGNVIFLLIAVMGAFWALLKLIAGQHERSLDKRFAELANTINANQALTRKLEAELMLLQGDIPRHYLRRDDYLREMKTMADANQRQFDPIRKSLERIEDFLLKQKT